MKNIPYEKEINDFLREMLKEDWMSEEEFAVLLKGIEIFAG